MFYSYCRDHINPNLFSPFLLLAILLTSGCASPPVRSILPEKFINTAAIPGVPNARFWGDEWPEFSASIFKNKSTKELQERFPGVYGKEHAYLAISGGGAEGAFGAGLLTGWTASGTRPKFMMVTGISTGALSAPFAFLGPEYDEKLREVYTTTETSEILEINGPFEAISLGAVTDSAPLRDLIEYFITDDIITAIAAEHRRGRRLLIGTFNLDAARSVIWNIGAIANSDYEKKNELIWDVMLASASIPVAFPPVLINVDVNGTTYDEMHVDGGTGGQVFVYPATFGWEEIMRKLNVPGSPKIYVIRNAFLVPDYHGVIPRIVPIAGRSISSLIMTQGVGDLYQIFVLCHRDGNDFNLAYIPSDFDEETEEPFDPEYMTKLFQLGRTMALQGYDWEKEPPGLRKQ
ncbi:MAG: hypothetical protein ACI8PB_004189 [Desulforhopalus sp.]|jgi:hypothetical protein